MEEILVAIIAAVVVVLFISAKFLGHGAGRS